MHTMLQSVRDWFRSIREELAPGPVLTALAGSAIMAFGLFNIHSVSHVTEGGILGLTLLIEHWFHISPAVSGLVMNLSCYALGWKLLGKHFLVYSIIASGGFSAFYALFEQIGPLFPQLADMPLTSALVGAVFVGVSAGMCVRVGAATGGDDALAMSIAKMTKMKIEWAYLLCDLVVLALSLSYIPFRRIAYSLLTVTLSGKLVGVVQRISFPKKCPA